MDFKQRIFKFRCWDSKAKTFKGLYNLSIPLIPYYETLAIEALEENMLYNISKNVIIYQKTPILGGVKWHQHRK